MLRHPMPGLYFPVAFFLVPLAVWFTGCAATRTTSRPDSGVWQPAPAATLAIPVSEQKVRVPKIAPPPDLAIRSPTTAPLKPTETAQKKRHNAVVLRMSSLVTVGTLVACEPEVGSAHALSDISNMGGDAPGPFEDAAIINTARSRLLGADAPGPLDIKSNAGVLEVKTGRLDVDQAAATLNALLGIQGVREVTLQTGKPFSLS